MQNDQVPVDVFSASLGKLKQYNRYLYEAYLTLIKQSRMFIVLNKTATKTQQ